MLKKELLNHKKEYFALLTGVFSFLSLFLLVWPDVFFIRLVALGMGTFYATWGILTHHYAPRKVFLEYVVIATLSFLSIFFLTL